MDMKKQIEKYIKKLEKQGMTEATVAFRKFNSGSMPHSEFRDYREMDKVGRAKMEIAIDLQNLLNKCWD